MAEIIASYTVWISLGLILLAMLIMLLTAPCHAVLLLPLAGIPLFWLLPLEYALPVNITAWLATPFLYRAIRKALNKPISNDGFLSLVGTRAEVVSKSETVSSAKYLVQAQGEGELWSAYSSDVLNIGEWVKIVAVKGIGMVVERENKEAEVKQTGEEKDERHCH